MMPQLAVTTELQQLQFQIRSLEHLHNRINKHLMAVSMYKRLPEPCCTALRR